MVSVPGAPGDLKVMRAVDGGQEDKEEGKDNSTTSVDFRLARRARAIEAFLETAFDACVEQTAKEEAGGRHLCVRGGGGGAKDDDSDDGSGAATYKRYRLAASRRSTRSSSRKGRVAVAPRRVHAGTEICGQGLAEEAGSITARPARHGQGVADQGPGSAVGRSIVSIRWAASRRTRSLTTRSST